MKSRIMFIAFLWFVIGNIAEGQVPNKISYQGLLTTSSGIPVPNGSYDLQFKLFNVATGGTELWSETHLGVNVQRGTFTVALGSVSTLPDIFDQPLYAEITLSGGPGIGSSTTISPRVELMSGPYALRAKVSESAIAAPPTGVAGGDLTGSYPNPTIAANAVSSTKIAGGAVSTLKIADNAITSSKIGSGEVGTSDVADGAISNSKLAGNAVTSDKILDGTIATADIADGTVTSAKIATGSIVGTGIADGSVTTAKLADNAVATDKISDGTISNSDVSTGAAIATTKLSGAVTSIASHGLGSLATLSAVSGGTVGTITDGTITNDDVSATAAVSTSKLSGAVTSIASHGLGSLATMSAVSGGTSGTITDGTITNDDISATAAVSTSKFSGAVTSIASHGLGSLATSSAVSGGTGGTITDGTIANADVSSTAAIATSKLSGAVTSITGHGLGSLATLNAVGSSEITDGTIATDDLAGSSVTSAKIADGASGVSLTTDVGGVLPIANGGTNNSTAYTSGSVIFSDGTKLTQDNSNLYWDDTNNRLGIGTTSPTGKLHVVTSSNTDTDQPRVLSGSSTSGDWNEIILGANVADYRAAGFRYFNGLGTSANSRLCFFNFGDAAANGINLIGGGNVGIGTISPNTRLHAYDASGDILKLQTSDAMSTAGTRVGITFRQSTDTEVNRIQAITESATNIGMAFWTYNGSIGERVRITSGGSVGIGTTNPVGLLQVDGGQGAAPRLFATGSSAQTYTTGENSANTVLLIRKDDGTGRSINAAGTINASGADYAEYFYQETPGDLQKGELVCLAASGKVKKCEAGEKIIGVVSTNAGFVGNDLFDAVHPENTALIGLMGQVPLKFSLENGPINVGDRLTISPSRPGYAMKGTTTTRTIGFALQNYLAPTADEKIIVFIQPEETFVESQFYVEPVTGNIGIGTTSPGTILTVAQGSSTNPIAEAWTIFSSQRWSNNIKPLERAMERVERLQGVSFDRKTDGKRDIGLIGEDVGKVVPEVVAYEENGKDAKSVDYARLVALLIEGMKEQQREIEEMRKLLNSLSKNQINDDSERLANQSK